MREGAAERNQEWVKRWGMKAQRQEGREPGLGLKGGTGLLEALTRKCYRNEKGHTWVVPSPRLLKVSLHFYLSCKTLTFPSDSFSPFLSLE